MTIRDSLSIESRSDDARVCLSAVALGPASNDSSFESSLLACHGSRPSMGGRSRSFTTLEPLSKPAIAHHGGDPLFKESATASRRRSSREDLRRTSAWRQRSPFGDPGRHAREPRRRDLLSGSASCRHDIPRVAFAFRRCSPRHAAQRSRPCTSSEVDVHKLRSLRDVLSEDSHRGACVHLHLSVQISARNRRRTASFDADVSFHLHLFREGFCCHRLSPSPRHPPPSWPFDQDFGRHSCPPRFTSILRCPPTRRTSVPGPLRISRRSRSTGTSVLTLAHVFVSTYRSNLISLAHLSICPRLVARSRYTRLRTCSVHASRRERTHSLRAFIFSVLSSRKFGSPVSERPALLELLSLPTKAPGVQTPKFSPRLPRSRKLSLVRLAALLNQ